MSTSTGAYVRALVRRIPDRYGDATRGALGDPAADGPIDVVRAREQHAGYVAALRSVGVTVTEVPGDGGSADATFVEDLAVVVDGRALVCRPGHPGRRGEADAVEETLRASGLQVLRMREEHGVLEGGDVLRVGRRLLVGRSARTDLDGVRALAAAFPDLEVVVVPLPAGLLHLKCVASLAAPEHVLLAAGTLDARWFPGCRVIEAPPSEPWGANVVGFGGSVIAAAGHPGTTARLVDVGLDVVEIDLSEIRKGDGSPTCLSVLVG